MSWYLKALKNYAGFSGRARRREYWIFILFNNFIFIALSFLDIIIYNLSSETVIGMLSGAYLLAVILPSLAVTFRRLHDSGKSGWWVFINLVPMVGSLVFIIILFLDSQPGENQYGPSPKSEIKFTTVGIWGYPPLYPLLKEGGVDDKNPHAIGSNLNRHAYNNYHEKIVNFLARGRWVYPDLLGEGVIKADISISFLLE